MTALGKRFGLFSCGSFNYAVPLDLLKKILQGTPVYKLPLRSGGFVKVLVVDNVAVPVLELYPYVGVEPRAAEGPHYQAILDSEYGQIALVSDLPGRITAKGECLSSDADSPSWIVGKYSFQDENYAILNIDSFAMEMAGRLDSRSMPVG
jgi:hypothetical protein